MATTVQNLIDFAQTFTQYSPLAVGTGNQPALGIANEIQNLMMNPPFTWGWNRAENNAVSTVPGTQDYVMPVPDFGFLEKVTLTDPTGNTWNVSDVYNTAALGLGDATTNKRNRPNSASVHTINFGTSFKLRFLAVPDQIYLITIDYQKLVAPLTALTGAGGILVVPDQYIDIFDNLFVGEALANVDDGRANTYRQRGVTALLAKSEGLDEMQKNLFLEIFWQRDRQMLAGQLRTQQAAQARGV
jgi:hypothetical protein